MIRRATATCSASRAAPGNRIVAEVYARRLDSPLDSLLKLTDAGGQELALNDDYEDKGAGLITHQADSWFSATLPADGTYYLHLSDAQHKGGPEYAYRLRIGPPRPDFELRVVPSSINARAGLTVPITVYAIRKRRFSGDITLALKDAPEGLPWRDAGAGKPGTGAALAYGAAGAAQRAADPARGRPRDHPGTEVATRPYRRKT